MWDIKELEEQRRQLVARATAIIQMSSEAGRSTLTPEDQAEFDSIQGEGGKIDQLDANIKRLKGLEARQAQIATQQFVTGNTEIQRNGTRQEADIFAAVRVPAAHMPRNPLKAFTGENAIKAAYITGMWALATIYKRKDALAFMQDIGLGHNCVVQSAMTVGENEKGGFLVPDITEATIIRNVQTFGVLRQYVGRVWPLNSGSLSVPKHGTGFTWSWVGERQTIPESDLTLGRVNLVAKKGGVLGRISSELFEDSIVALGDYIATEIAWAKARAEDDAAFNGNGDLAYGGIVGLRSALQAGCISTAEANDNTLSELTALPIHDCMGKVQMYPNMDLAWYMHSSVWENGFKRLAFALGEPTHWMQGIGPMFLGYPVRFTQIMPSGGPLTDLASTIIAYFGDLSKTIAMGEARGLQIVGDTSVFFATDEVAVRGTTRLDIQVHETGTASACGSMSALRLNTA
jgi:HK97 family phage major capsid protein